MEQKYFIGSNALVELESLLVNLKADNIFMVRGKHSYEACGGNETLEPLFRRNHITVHIFTDYSPNPTMTEVNAGIKAFKQSRSHIIIGMGGGSAMDTAKIIRARTDLDATLIAIPTTSGTGAEATGVAIAETDGVKQTYDGPGIFPDYAFVYPAFTYGNPAYLSVCTGIDAVAQCIEAYWNVNATEESDVYALRGLEMMWTVLPNAIEPGFSHDDRKAMAEGAYWSGRAINICRTTAPHAFSYIFTTKYGYAHGHAVALSLPYFYGKNTSCPRNKFGGKDYDKYTAKMRHLKSVLGIDNEDMMLEYVSNIGLRKFDASSIDWKYYFDNISPNRLKNNPYVMDEKDRKELKDFFSRAYR
jgi:alcohol dehydrogenase class IV